MRATRNLRDHAPGDGAVIDKRIEFVGSGLADERRCVVDVAAEAFDVGQVDQFLGVERFGNCPCCGVGVDVVCLTGFIAADRRNDRNEFVVEQSVDHLRINGGDIADEAEFWVSGMRPDQPAVDAADTNGVVAMHVDCCDELRVDLTFEHHAGNLNGFGVGDAQPVNKLRHFAEPLHERRDLRPTTVDDDRPHPDETHHHDVLREQRQRVVA